MNLKELAKPFPASDIEWRVGRAGVTNGKVWAMVLAYINARAVMDRLDEVCEPQNWKDRYWSQDKANMCGLSIKVGEEWVEKIDGAEATDIEPVKGGISGAFKRAAVKWRIGRYLYDLEEGFARIVEKGTPGAHYAKVKGQDGKDVHYYWLPPELPDWALPEASEGPKDSAPKAKPASKPSPVQSNDPGEFKIPFGKFEGMLIKNIDMSYVKNDYDYLANRKNLSGNGLKYFNALETFLKEKGEFDMPLSSQEIPY